MLDNKEDFPEFTFHEINGMRLTCPEQVHSFAHLGTRNSTEDLDFFAAMKNWLVYGSSWGVYIFSKQN
jgi:hypothetical protein